MLMTKRGCLRLASAAAVLVFLYACLWVGLGLSPDKVYHIGHDTAVGSESSTGSAHLPCCDLPGGNETLIILRTGSTELQDRFTVHTSTSLRCFPNYLIFSDYAEDFLGEHILDALDSVSPEIIAHHQDFELYRRLKQSGRASLAPNELSGTNVEVEGASGNAKNPGWKLDKWKFHPMLTKTLSDYPDMKWYVFIEADTLIFWSTLQAYLATLDHTTLFYGGDNINIGKISFAHGGTGFLVSQSALRTLVEYYIAHKSEIEAFLDTEWAGDGVLGKTFSDAGVRITDTYPLMQGQDPGLVLYAGESSAPVPKETWQVWCSPTVSYHHLSPTVLQDLWNLEQQWLEARKEESDILRHKDIFSQYVMPQMKRPRINWDNLSDEDHGSVTSMEDCRRLCEKQPDCKQYSFDDSGQCKTRVNPRLGLARDGVQSGWIEERVLQFERSMAPCDDHGLRLAISTSRASG